ncbi:carboxymethylenebutenolidase homolog isoform X2 [Dasypus novemcinctus]|uniref:carboxymethylenebutenolidase homolog isoform X2 n=1 Tax=Dasypus novemcinctus TaxID=9361 RepID=UPI00062A7176|nr:carboxymethylenebutenolidase homolog isoform X2 [Dasypus novemcinctus]
MANEADPRPCDIGHKLEYGGMGREVQVEHIQAYVSKPPVDTGKAVIVIHDIFGWQLSNTRYIADMITGNGYTEIDAVLKYLKQQCHAQKVGVVGFCWGGVAVHHVMTKYSEFRAGVSVYGIVKDFEDIYSLKNPTLFIFAENDAVISLEQVSLLTQKLKEHCKVEYQVKTFSGQTHGFVHRKREDCSPADKPYVEEARRNLIEWLNKYV